MPSGLAQGQLYFVPKLREVTAVLVPLNPNKVYPI